MDHDLEIYLINQNLYYSPVFIMLYFYLFFGIPNKYTVVISPTDNCNCQSWQQEDTSGRKKMQAM